MKHSNKTYVHIEHNHNVGWDSDAAMHMDFLLNFTNVQGYANHKTTVKYY